MPFPSRALLLIVAFCAGCSGLRDTHERLHSVLWMQQSAEYYALVNTTYHRAVEALDRALVDKTWTAAVEQEGDFALLPPAVILDLDETVLDNTPFEAHLIKSRRPFVREEWDLWVEKASAGAVPGALKFIAEAQKKGITVFFVTNRRDYQEVPTRRNLAKLGVALDQDIDSVLSEGEGISNWPPDKTYRRRYLSKKYRILLLVGDDLGDFIEGAMESPDERLHLARQNMHRWGISWFLIPNPIYGSWEMSLHPKSLSDAEILTLKRRLVRDSHYE